MTVYVDKAENPVGRMRMCHMVSPSLDELHAMADRIGVARRHFQDPATMPRVSRPHYDICKSKRELAIAAGAVELDRYRMSAMSRYAFALSLGHSRRKSVAFALELMSSKREELERWLLDEAAT